jgi:hypothetical protein
VIYLLELNIYQLLSHFMVLIFLVKFKASLAGALYHGSAKKNRMFTAWEAFRAPPAGVPKSRMR